MAGPVPASWIRPTSTEPEDFVERRDKREELRSILKDHLDSGIRQCRILVTGDRGIGKPILSRTVVAELQSANRNRVVAVVVDGRAIGFRRCLKDLATQLVERLRPLLEVLPKDSARDLGRWLDELALIAGNDEISRGQVETVARKHGAEAGVETGLFAVLMLKARFLWEETRTRGAETRMITRVTDDLLHAALTETLEQIAATPWTVMVLFDDLDQAIGSEDPMTLKEVLKRVLDVKPCIGLLHLRTEVLFADIRREIDEEVDVSEMSSEALSAILRRRLERAPDSLRPHRRALQESQDLARLAQMTGNPLVFLRWVHGVLRIHGFPPPPDWHSDTSLRRMVRKEAVAGVNDDLLARFARVVDRCLTSAGTAWCQRTDLLAGRVSVDPHPAQEILTEQELEHLEQVGFLIPRNRFNPESGYRIDPVLDLLRPSVAERLRSR